MSAEPKPVASPALDAVQINMLKTLRNGELLPKLLRTYHLQATQQLANLQSALADRACAEIGTIAHGFKSASYSIGAKHVGELCAQLETHARNAQPLDCAALYEPLQQRVAEVLAEIDTYLS